MTANDYGRLRRFLSWLAVTLSVAVFGTFLFLTASITLQHRQEMVNRFTRELTRSVAELAYVSADLWRFQLDRIVAKVDARVSEHIDEQWGWSVRIFDLDGETIYQRDTDPYFIYVIATAPIVAGFDTVGRIETRIELKGFLMELLPSFVLAIVFSLSMFGILYWLPFRALQQRELELERLTERALDSEGVARASRNRLTRAIESMKDGFALFGKDGKLVLWNKPYEDVFVASGGSLHAGMSYANATIYKDSTAGNIPAQYAPLANAQEKLHSEALEPQEIRTQTRRVLVVNQFKTAQGEVIILVNDVTDQRTVEARLRQAQKMEIVGQLTGGLAHDFNNLLAIISGNLELLEDDIGARAQITSAMNATDRGAALTQRMLAFSRRQALQPEAIDLNMLIAGMSEMIRRTLGEAIEIEIMDAEDLWACEADPGQMESAVLNLAVNARDAMPEGGKLTIETRNTQLDEAYTATERDVEPGEYVMLAISDSGSGIPSEDLPHVFEPFFTTKAVGKGSGLGLSMVYGFVKQSGGHVKIYSESGEGTTVKIYLPRTGLAVSARDQPLQEPEPRGQAETILVVEDDEEVRRFTVETLERLNYRVIEAHSGRAALSLLENGQKIDLLLTDLVLPEGMSGRELAEEIQGRDAETCVLYMSGYTRNTIVHNGRLDAGVSLLQKPFRRAELAIKVRQALDRAEH